MKLRQRLSKISSSALSGKISFGLWESVLVAVLATLVTIVAAYSSGTLLTAGS